MFGKLYDVFSLKLGLSPLESTSEHASKIDISLEWVFSMSMQVNKSREYDVYFSLLQQLLIRFRVSHH